MSHETIAQEIATKLEELARLASDAVSYYDGQAMLLNRGDEAARSSTQWEALRDHLESGYAEALKIRDSA